jgi:Sel1 repeat
MLCGVSMVATVLRSRLTIEESKIRFRIIFREEIIPLSEIEGLRTITTEPKSRRVSRSVICVRGRSEPIEIVQFEHDDYLQTWLQQFPHLDQSDGAPVQRVRWVIVAITCMALIGAGILVSTELRNRRLAKQAAAYRIRAEQGDAKSQFALGAMYYYGMGVREDYAEAARWYLKSAEQGDVNAQYSMASIYHYGKGLPQDDLEAARWCRKAAEQGDAEAQYALGLIYHRGQGLPQDYAEALRWYRKSADQGYSRAEYALGLLYYYGNGVARDRVQARDFFQQAAAHGSKDGKRALECSREGRSIDPGAGLRGLQ